MTAQLHRPQAHGPQAQKRPGKRQRALLLAAGVTLGATAPAALMAQDAGGLQLTFGLDSRIASHSNLDLETDAQSSTLSDTRFSFGLRKATATSYLDLSAGALLRQQLGGSASYTEGLVNPDLALTFGHENSDASLSGGLSFRETDLSTSQALDDFDSNTGTRRSKGGDLSLLWGRDSRVTWRIGASANYVSYADSPGNEDRRTLSYNTGADMALTETLSLDIGLRRSDYKPDDAEKRVTDTLSADLSTELSNGSMGLSATFADAPEGNRESLSVSRAYELSRGEISASLGVSRGVSGHTGMIGSLTYAHELTDGMLSLDISRSLTTSSETDREVENTRANISLSREITERIGMSMNLGLAKQTYTEEDASDTDRIMAGLSASYALGQDWQATAGLNHISRKEDGQTDRDNSIYIGIRKTFERSY